jgi:hypothetical protein
MYVFPNTPESFEKQVKVATVQGIDYTQNAFVESIELFDSITKNAFSIHTQKAVESVKTFNQCLKGLIETAQISKVFGSAGKK